MNQGSVLSFCSGGGCYHWICQRGCVSVSYCLPMTWSRKVRQSRDLGISSFNGIRLLRARA